jgi:hypothetical protein
LTGTVETNCASDEPKCLGAMKPSSGTPTSSNVTKSKICKACSGNKVYNWDFANDSL